MAYDERDYIPDQSVAASIVDMFELKDRVVYEPMVFAAFGATNIIGPVLGGLFVDHLSWRFIFWLTAIVFTPSLIILYYLLDIPLKPNQTLSRENLKTLIKRIDPIGCILAAAGIIFFLLGMHFPSAMIAFIQFQAVYNTTATQAATRLIPGTACLIISSITGSKLTRRLGNAKYLNILGFSLNVFACLLILYVETPDSGIALQIICLMIFNSGMGFSGQSNGVSMQLILEKKAPELIPAALSLGLFLVISAGALCVAIVITMLRTQVENQVQIFKITQPDIYQAILSSGAYDNYIKVREITSKDLHSIVQTIYYNSVHNIVYMFLGLCIVGLICALIIKTPSISNLEQEKKKELEE
ncbi:MFS general substrate transporter [Backusella circina FSU 941]|nr:MFS general substrate transporter [Backusella circina FSU 941]